MPLLAYNAGFFEAERSLGDINTSDQTVAHIDEHERKTLLSEKLHVGTGSIDLFGFSGSSEWGVLGVGYGRHAQGSHNSLGFTLRKELTQFLEGSARQSL